MDRTVLSLSCLNGQLKAVVVSNGSAGRSWDRSDLVDDFSGFGAILKEAVAQTGFTGQQVAMVIGHPRLNNQIVEIPPIKGWALDRFVERRAPRLKTFEGEAAWSYQRAMPTKNSEAILVHLFPRALLEQLAQGCEEAGLQLVRVLSTTSVLAAQLKELPVEKEDVALLAAETEATTTVVIGRRDGRVCLGRVLSSSWQTRPDRVAVDIMRTIGFAEQQTALSVTSIWPFGVETQARLPEMQALLKVQVKPSPVPHRPFYWAEQAAKLSAKDDGNLVSLEAREAPQRRRFLTLTSMVLLILLLASLGTAAFFEWQRRIDLKMVQKLDAEINRSRELRADWQQRHADLLRKRDLVRIVTSEKPPALPVWLLGYLSDATPEDLLLTDVRVLRTNESWTVRIVGATQPATNGAAVDLFSNAFSQMTNGLATGPFHLEITQSTLRDGPATASSTSLPEPVPAGPKQSAFLIEAVMR